MARKRNYIIRLTQEEFSILDKTIENKKTCQTVLKRCQILRALDEVKGTGQTHQQIAETYGVCLTTVSNIIKAYMSKGIDEVTQYHLNPNSSAALREAHRRARERLM